MNYPVILMMHNIEGRVRLKLSHPIINIKKSQEFISGTNGIDYLNYNETIKSLVIKFNPAVINLENVILKVAMLLSDIYGFSKIKFVTNSNKNEMPLLSYYSIISILGANLVKFFSPSSQVEEFINWIATGSTVGAILEHGYWEMTQRGTIDPEVMSIMYLVNSIGKGNMLNASLISWITTFGRHILKKSHESFFIKVEKVQVKCSDKICYDISVLPYEQEKNNKMDSFRLFASEIIESQNRCLNSTMRVRQGNFNNRVFCNIK